MSTLFVNEGGARAAALANQLLFICSHLPLRRPRKLRRPRNLHWPRFAWRSRGRRARVEPLFSSTSTDLVTQDSCEGSQLQLPLPGAADEVPCESSGPQSPLRGAADADLQNDEHIKRCLAGDRCVKVLYDFNPSDVPWPFEDQRPLPLHKGQLIRVLMTEPAGDWAFGHPLRQPDTLGFFPSNYTVDAGNVDEALMMDSGAGVCLDASGSASASSGASVVVVRAFDPSLIEWPFKEQQPLSLMIGQHVRIVLDDAESHWAWGHLLDRPEVEGFFPKTCTKPLAESDKLRQPWAVMKKGALWSRRKLPDIQRVVPPPTSAEKIFTLHEQREQCKRVAQSHVVVVQDFDPSDVDWPVQHGKPMALRKGQILQLIRESQGVWTWGHPLGQPEALGYFPSRCTVPLGTPALSAEEEELEDLVLGPSETRALRPSGPEDVFSEPERPTFTDSGIDGCDHMTIPVLESTCRSRPVLEPLKDGIVGVLYDFDPGAIDWPFESQKPLPLQVGQVIQVLSDGEAHIGWSLGHPVGQPDLEGYFPISYTVAVSAFPDELPCTGKVGN